MSLRVEPGVPTEGNWQYHPRSDRHSRVACWCILFDLLQNCALLAAHARAGSIGFGINHKMRDFRTDRQKKLDLVVCTPGSVNGGRPRSDSLRTLAMKYRLDLTPGERRLLEEYDVLHEVPVGEVRLALEAKACMTEHGKARPRLYDELSSSHLTIHGSSDAAIAVGFVMVNLSATFLSPLRKPAVDGSPAVTKHTQPKDTLGIIEKVKEIQRRTHPGEVGFDAIGVVVVRCVNDGSPVQVVKGPPAPKAQDLFHYESMIRKMASLYESRFPRV